MYHQPIDHQRLQPLRPSLLRHLEALLFAAGEALAPEEIARCLRASVAPQLTEGALQDALDELQADYARPDRTYALVCHGGAWRLLTKPAYHPTLAAFHKERSGKRLSRAALETLSIVAYKQPLTRADVEAIRGVGAGYAINKLLERELIAIVGRAEGPGRPLLYGTSERFMEYFGLSDLGALPKLREVGEEKNAIGESAE